MRGLVVPGLNGSGAEHWQTLWEHTYRLERVRQRDWANPDVLLWTAALDAAVVAHPTPVVIIAHSLGCWTVMHWAARHFDSTTKVKGALLVAPPDLESTSALPKAAVDFSCNPRIKLPFPSVLVGSQSDPYMTLDRARLLARRTGSRFINAGSVGHINVDSGHGAWPAGEGLLRKMMARD